jgi:aminoglycoside phosphotransferase (APT) family kinase protein
MPALRRERDILKILSPSMLPVPEFLFYLEMEPDPELEGWLVTRRLPGEPLLQFLQGIEQTEVGRPLLVKLGKLLAELHTKPVPPELAKESSQWLEGMIQLAETDLPLGFWEGSQKELEEMKQIRPALLASTFIHGDLFLDNVLTDGNEITGLIDWAFGDAGDPRYDLVLALHELAVSERAFFFEGYGKIDRLDQPETDYFLTLARFT